MAFPQQRLRRTRRTAGLRGLVRETRLSPEDLVYPIFVTAGEDVRNPVVSMPGIFQLSINHAVTEAQRANDLGIPAVLLFGLPEQKDEAATGAYDPEGIVQLATRAIKEAAPELLVVTDVCLCEYTSHGHCGVVEKETGEVLNDVSLELLARTAASQAIDRTGRRRERAADSRGARRAARIEARIRAYAGGGARRGICRASYTELTRPAIVLRRRPVNMPLMFPIVPEKRREAARPGDGGKERFSGNCYPPRGAAESRYAG